MKKLIAIFALTVASVFAVNAQSVRTQNETVIAYNFVSSDVSVARLNKPRFNEDTDSHGVSLGYTRYAKGVGSKVGVLGLTGEITANFDSREASLVTAMVGGTAKARNNSVVQPYLRVLGGVARQHINRTNVLDTTDVSVAVDGGVGLDFAFKSNSRYGLRTGVDYLNTGFNGERQNAVRATVGFVF